MNYFILLLLQLCSIFTETINVKLGFCFEILTIIYGIILLIINKYKNKKIVIIFSLLSVFLAIIYLFLNVLDIQELNIIKFLYVPIILLTLRSENYNKRATLNIMFYAIIAINIACCINTSVVKEAYVMAMLPLVFILFDKKVKPVNIFLIILNIFTFAVYLVDFPNTQEYFITNNNLLKIFGILFSFIPAFLLIIKSVKLFINNIKKVNIEIISLFIAIMEFFTAIIINEKITITSIILFTYFVDILLKKLKNIDKKLDDKKITIVALHLGFGGIEQYLSSLCSMLNDDYNIEILSTYKMLDKPAFTFDEKIKIKYLTTEKQNKEEFKKAVKNKNIKNIVKELFKALKLLYIKRFTGIEEVEKINSKYIITTRDYHNNMVGTYARKDIIKIATEHNYHNDNKKYVNNLISSVKYMNYFVLVSERLKDYYKDKVKPECVYIPNVLDKLPSKQSKAKNHTLISIGRLSKEKGQNDLIELVKLLKNDYKDIKLYLIGDGEEKNNLENLISKYKLKDNVILTGFLDKENIEPKMLDSSVFVSTSHTESFGLAALEANSYKIPVVAFDEADGLKTLLANDNGILISNRNLKKMKTAIIDLFEDKKYKDKIANNGYENCKNYLKDNIKKEWQKLLK